jgi:hypothetical protein
VVLILVGKSDVYIDFSEYLPGKSLYITVNRLFLVFKIFILLKPEI